MLALKIRIFDFLLIMFVFQMFVRAANSPLALLILVLIPACVFPSFVNLAPRYVNSVTSSMYCSLSLAGSPMDAIESLFKVNEVYIARCFHSWHCSIICLRVNMCSPQYVPFLNSAGSLRIIGSRGVYIIFRIKPD